MALLPFVDEKRLWAAPSPVYPDLTDLESKFVVVKQSLLKYILSYTRAHTLHRLCFPAINVPLRTFWETEHQVFGARIAGIV